jgi:Protein of unknown function/AsmA-like C-terminal region
VLRWLGSLAAVLILVALFGMWRLMQGPIALDWLAPYVEAAFDSSGIALKVKISGVRFGLDRNTQQLDLWAEDVHVSLPNGEPVASFPEMATSFALGALLRGRLEPTQVVVERPVLHLVRDAGGTITARIGSGDQAPDLGPQTLEQLAGPREADAPLGLLRELRIRGATVSVDDRGTGQTWRADRVDLTVQRSEKGVRGEFSLAMPLGTSLPEVRASYRYFADRQVLDLDLSIDGVEPTDIPPLIPELAQLQHIDAPVSGVLRTRIDLANHQPMGSRLDLALGKGRLHSEFLPTGSVALDKGELHIVYAPETATAHLEKLALDLGGGAELVLDGGFTGVTPELIAAPADARPPGHVAATLSAALRGVPAARLGELWPPAFSVGGRRWALANIQDGLLDEAAVQFAVDLDPVTHATTVSNARGSLHYHDLTINFFNGLPLVHKVSGTANFADKRLEFIPTGGQLKGVKVTGGSLQITDLGDRVETLTIDLALAGPLQDTLEVIDSKPLRYAHAIGIDPAHISGRAETQLHFKFPLVYDLKFEMVDYAVKSTVSGANLGKVVLDRVVSEGNLAIDIAPVGAHAQGTIRFDGIPAKIDANVPFHAKAGPHAVYRVALTLDGEAQHRLDLDFAPDRLKGPIAADVTYTALPSGRGEAVALLDLRSATLAMPEAGWSKPPDQPASAKVVLDLDNEKISGIPQIDVKAPGLDGRFVAQLTADRRQLDRVEIGRLVVGKSEVSGVVSRRSGGGWQADIHAPHVDAQPLLKEAASGAPSVPSQPLAVTAKVERLVLGPQRELRQLSVGLVRTGGIWQSGRIEGHYSNGHRLSLRFGEDGGRHLVFQSEDFGAALQAFDIADTVVGGRVTVEGQFAETSGKRTLQAHIDGENYTLVHAPVMAQLLAVPSLTGFASMLSGSGLPFSTLRGDVAYSGSRLTLDRFLAFGESLGVTAEGWIDLDHDRLELHGTVAPAYLLNSIIGHVPIIGQILGGGSQGLFAANYRLSGPSGDPQVTVNPLSALAPGILREIFKPIVGVGTAQRE